MVKALSPVLFQPSAALLRTASFTSHYKYPWGSMRRREVRPLVYKEDGSVQKVLRARRMDTRAMVGTHAREGYWEERYNMASDFERFALDYPWVIITFIFILWITAGALVKWALFPFYEWSIDDWLAATKGGATRGQLMNLGILRDVDVRLRHNFSFWNAQPTFWYGDEYAGAPRVGNVTVGKM